MKSKFFDGEFKSAALTDIGKRREANQDEIVSEPELGFFAVCDGMGGLESGGLASKGLCEHLRAFAAARENAEDAGEALKDEIKAFNAKIYEEQNKSNISYGTTCCAAWLAGGAAYIVSAGDSRAYLYSDGALTQITKDHSLAWLLIERNDITKDEGRSHPTSSQLLKFVGMKGDLNADVFPVSVKSGDILLLCSDGLWGMLGDEKIGELISEKNEPDEKARVLVGAANDIGGKDNISVVLIEIFREGKNGPL
jgi:protein phosphatase